MYQKNCLRLIGLFILSLHSKGVMAGNEGPSGGDAFRLDNQATVIFEKLECSEGFDPKNLPAYREIDNSIQKLREKLPKLADFVEDIFGNSGPLWCWVDSPLVNVNDEGGTHIRLSLNWKKIQLGVFDGQIAYIHRPTFQNLDTNPATVSSQSRALMHEATWAMVERNSTCINEVQGDSIRKFVNLLLHPYLSNKTPQVLAELLSAPFTSGEKFQELENIRQPSRWGKYKCAARILTPMAEDLATSRQETRLPPTPSTVAQFRSNLYYSSGSDREEITRTLVGACRNHLSLFARSELNTSTSEGGIKTRESKVLRSRRIHKETTTRRVISNPNIFPQEIQQWITPGIEDTIEHTDKTWATTLQCGQPVCTYIHNTFDVKTFDCHLRPSDVMDRSVAPKVSKSTERVERPAYPGKITVWDGGF